MPDHRATYSPQDNKVRLFFAYRIDRTEWDRLREAGFSWTMKQASDMVAIWSPEREDIALELCGDIGDEDQPREERSADRAERFEGYGDKREGEAVALADRYDSGPRVHGNQSAARAERSAARHDRIGGRAVSQWSKAEYWQQRTAGVIAHALYLEEPGVRHRRIKGLEADLRRVEGYSEGRAGRWADHYRLRLDYERQMLAAQGGTAADIEMEAGGFVGKFQVQKISKDRAGRVNRVYFRREEGGRLCAYTAHKLPPGSYRAPTDEERAAFAQAKKEGKAGDKKQAPLLNPSAEAAAALVESWNAATNARREQDKKTGNYYCEGNYGNSIVVAMTAAEWTAMTKRGDMFATRELDAAGRTLSRWDDREKPRPAVCRIRLRLSLGRGYGVVTITDRPGVALPLVATAATVTA